MNFNLMVSLQKNFAIGKQVPVLVVITYNLINLKETDCKCCKSFMSFTQLRKSK
jgi:hypothetical protein